MDERSVHVISYDGSCGGHSVHVMNGHSDQICLLANHVNNGVYFCVGAADGMHPIWDYIPITRFHLHPEPAAGHGWNSIGQDGPDSGPGGRAMYIYQLQLCRSQNLEATLFY